MIKRHLKLQDLCEKRRILRPATRYPAQLPITACREEIVAAIRRHQVLIVTGETGSGKSTQLPKMCLEAGRGIRGLIGCTQPRRVAAAAIARRIAEELGEELGNSVAYKIRFDERSGPHPYIKVMTDGILLMEAQSDRLLRRYDTIIVDEAHERSLNIDLLIGFLQTILPRRRDLKVIITSATLETEKFAQALGNAPVIKVSGRLFPVEVRWRPPVSEDGLDDGGAYADGAVTAVADLERNPREGRWGDILIFMPTEQDIRDTCAMLAGRFGDDKVVVPMFSRLSWEDQQRVFRPEDRQKIVVATNVAETSLTIPNIRYVIDTGLARISQYNPRSRTAGLPVTPISQSSADQRLGRCGRVGNGICIRLYSEDDYLSRPAFTLPEIKRANLAGVVLRMLALNFGDIFTFPFLEPPDKKQLRDALDILRELGAVRMGEGPTLTEIGRFMARLPVDPRMARMLVAAASHDCLEEMLVITSALSIVDPRERPRDQAPLAAEIHGRFHDPTSDFITFLNIWKRCQMVWEESGSQGRLRKFCRDHFLSWRRMREWQDLHRQLQTMTGEVLVEGRQGEDHKAEVRPSRLLRHLPVRSQGPKRGREDKNASIHKAVLTGFLSGIAVRKEKNIYTAPKGRTAMIFPGSGVFGTGADWIVAAEWVETSRLFARTVAVVQPEWIEGAAGELCRTVYSEPYWNRERGEVQASARIVLFDMVIIPHRTVSFGRINPAAAREIFIREGIMTGSLKKSYPFLSHNEQVLEGVRVMENKLRRRGWLWNEETVFEFYRRHLPEEICEERSLQRCIRQRGSDEFLWMEQTDVLLAEPDENALREWPDAATVQGIPVPLIYNYNPGGEDDGVTARIMAPLLAADETERLAVAIPGIRREIVREYLQSLPKSYRRRLPSLSDVTDTILMNLNDPDRPLPEVLSRLLNRHYDLDLPITVWQETKRLGSGQIRYLLTDEEGRELSHSRSLPELRECYLEKIKKETLHNARKQWEIENIQSWDFNDLPESIPLGDAVLPVDVVYPALRDEDGIICLRLLDSPKEALAVHRQGVAALYERHFAAECKYLKKVLLPAGNMKLHGEKFGGSKKVQRILYSKALLDLFFVNVRTNIDYLKHAAEVKSLIIPHAKVVLQLAAPVLEANFQAEIVLDRLEKQYGFSKPHREHLTFLRRELACLIPEDFLNRYPAERIRTLSRYIRGLIIRAERAMLNLDKALAKAGEVDVYREQWRQLTVGSQHSPSLAKMQAQEDFFWFLEEYKISLFAQELKTTVRVSPKRLEERLRELRAML
ncbi:MAG TPA: ATP-dependent RNA helicase HrpA [Syntrophales bacterium]|nr:ATP-dependent RNA helicase HrpA [Syntrophales bacterium]